MQKNLRAGGSGRPSSRPIPVEGATRLHRHQGRANRCALVLLLTALISAWPGHRMARAFDGKREGFTLGVQAGTAHIVRSGTDSASGLATQLQLGWGLSESFRISGTAQADVLWHAADLLHPNSSATLEGGATTVELTYYPRGAKGPWFAVAGLGAGTVHDRSWGFAFHSGVGLEFWRGAQLQLTLARYGGSESHNASDRIMLGWIWK